MPQSAKAIFLKLSGESLNGGGENSPLWVKKNYLSVINNIVSVYQDRHQLNITGLTVVPGAGNIARGRELASQEIQHPDLHGRIGIIQNAILLRDELLAGGIEVNLMVPSSMTFQDEESGIKFESFTVENMKAAHEAGKIVIIGGGSGLDDCTTDYAVLYYALPYAKRYEEQIIVLKGTKYDGIFNADPALDPNAKRYRLISAQQMINDYERYSALDSASLQLLAGSNLQVHVFAENKHNLTEVISHQSADPAQNNIGTMVIGQGREAVYYS